MGWLESGSRSFAIKSPRTCPLPDAMAQAHTYMPPPELASHTPAKCAKYALLPVASMQVKQKLDGIHTKPPRRLKDREGC